MSGINNFIDNLEFSENIKKVLKILTWIVPIFFGFYVIYIAFIESDHKKLERVKQSTLEYTVSGIVKRKYISSNHQIPTTVLSNGKVIGSDYGFYNLVQKNDSVSKEKDVMYIKIYRKKNEFEKYKYLDKEYFNLYDRNRKNE